MRSREARPDQDLVAAVVRARGRNRTGATKRDGWERELWSAYLVNGRIRPASNEPPPSVA